MTDTAHWLDRYQPWRRSAEIGFWIVAFLINAVFNSITVIMDVQRSKLHFAAWKPAVWETSSGLMILLLVPALVWFTRRFPLHRDTWRRHLRWYLPASIVWSLAHVVGMVALRKLVYATQGEQYDFGNWPLELGYEYLKDVREFVSTVALIHVYRFLLLRLQGEASLLAAPDVGPPVEPLDRPERFLVRKLGREFLIAAEDIEWIQASGNYVNLRVRGRDYPLRSTIAGIETRLDPQSFTRVHRSYLVNLDQITMIEPLETGDARLHLKDGTTVPCSRRYRSGLRERAQAA